MTSVKKMKRNLSLGIFIGAIVFCIMTIISNIIHKEPEESPIPDLIILPPPPEEGVPLDLHPPIELHPLDHDNVAQPRFEIKIQNEIEDEVLEVVATLADAKEYIAEYGQYHDDLFVYDKDTNELVLTSNKNE